NCGAVDCRRTLVPDPQSRPNKVPARPATPPSATAAARVVLLVPVEKSPPASMPTHGFRFNLEGRTITIGKDPEALAEVSKLDGCYVLKTDLSQTAASKDIVHDRYKDLALVEWAFRESKTVHLEIRPVNVRLETRTRGHAFVVM